MASNSESGFNFPASKAQSSSERARLDAMARGRGREMRGDGPAGLIGSISDLGEVGEVRAVGEVREVEPEIVPPGTPARPERAPDPPMSELELGGIPDAFFEAGEREKPSEDTFELPSTLGASAAPSVLGNEYPEPDADSGLGDDLPDIPSGFFRSVTDDASLELDGSGQAPNLNFGDTSKADMKAEKFDLDFDVRSVLGEQPEAPAGGPMNHREPETEPLKTAPNQGKQSNGHLTIPPVAAPIVRPTAGPSPDRSRDLESDVARVGYRTTRSSGSHTKVGRSALRGQPDIRDARPGVLVFPRIPMHPAYLADSVPRSLSDGAASRTRRAGVASGPYREPGRDPRPAKPLAQAPERAPLAALRRKPLAPTRPCRKSRGCPLAGTTSQLNGSRRQRRWTCSRIRTSASGAGR